MPIQLDETAAYQDQPAGNLRPFRERDRGIPIVGNACCGEGGLAAIEAFSAMPTDHPSPRNGLILVPHRHRTTKRPRRPDPTPYDNASLRKLRTAWWCALTALHHSAGERHGPAQRQTWNCSSLPPLGACVCPITFFPIACRSQQDMAVGIILSGNGSDGSLGIRAIKGQGGMVIAQIPQLQIRQHALERHRHRAGR